jgi:hypothetical protein
VIARGAFLEMRRDRVDVGGVRVVRQVRAGAARFLDERLEQEVRTLGSFDFENGVERVDPLAGFLRIYVLEAVHGRSFRRGAKPESYNDSRMTAGRPFRTAQTSKKSWTSVANPGLFVRKAF